MDINNYSYVNMESEINAIKHYENDDMYIDLTYQQNYFQEKYFDIYAYSYGGELEVSEQFEELNSAMMLYKHIIENYSSTAPDDTLDDYINELHNIEATHKTLKPTII